MFALPVVGVLASFVFFVLPDLPCAPRAHHLLFAVVEDTEVVVNAFGSFAATTNTTKRQTYVEGPVG